MKGIILEELRDFVRDELRCDCPYEEYCSMLSGRDLDVFHSKDCNSRRGERLLNMIYYAENKINKRFKKSKS
jgi:hypothetical protein